MKKKLTRFDLQNMKESGKKAVWVTSYDYWTAQFAEEAGMDTILLGCASMVMKVPSPSP
jgi:3-methyl-2-oxobutanoate hydroxymethyltransferase